MPRRLQTGSSSPSGCHHQKMSPPAHRPLHARTHASSLTARTRVAHICWPSDVRCPPTTTVLRVHADCITMIVTVESNRRNRSRPSSRLRLRLIEAADINHPPRPVPRLGSSRPPDAPRPWVVVPGLSCGWPIPLSDSPTKSHSHPSIPSPSHHAAPDSPGQSRASPMETLLTSYSSLSGVP